MQDHPLTPMRDPNLRRVLSRRTPHKVGFVPLATVDRGAEAVRADLARLRREGCRHAILGAVRDDDLLTPGAALLDCTLVTGGSGVALGLPDNFRRAGLLQRAQEANRLPPVHGAAAVISGACSTATLAQVAYMRRTNAVSDIDPLALAASEPDRPSRPGSAGRSSDRARGRDKSCVPARAWSFSASVQAPRCPSAASAGARACGRTESPLAQRPRDPPRPEERPRGEQRVDAPHRLQVVVVGRSRLAIDARARQVEHRTLPANRQLAMLAIELGSTVRRAHLPNLLAKKSFSIVSWPIFA